MMAGDAAAMQRAEKAMVVELLKAQFGSAASVPQSQFIKVTVPGNEVHVDWDNDTVNCSLADEALQSRVTASLERMRAALARLQPAQLSHHATSTAASV